MLKNSAIEFKGNKEGIVIYFDKNVDYIHLKEQLINRLEGAKKFFKGAKVASFQGRAFTEDEETELRGIINNQYGMILLERSEDNIDLETKKIFMGIEEGNTKFIRTTIRSGQKIEFNGNVVIIGDVNPGAEIVAEGNILVMGSMRGLAHAGSSGNEKAFVAAFCLQPKQLRIGDKIARSPDHDYIKPNVPELAKIKEGNLVIEPYLPKK